MPSLLRTASVREKVCTGDILHAERQPHSLQPSSLGPMEAVGPAAAPELSPALQSYNIFLAVGDPRLVAAVQQIVESCPSFKQAVAVFEVCHPWTA